MFRNSLARRTGGSIGIVMAIFTAVACGFPTTAAATCAGIPESGQWWNMDPKGDPTSLEITMDSCGDQVLNGQQTTTSFGLKVYVRQSDGSLFGRHKVSADYQKLSDRKRWLHGSVPTGGYVDQIWLRRNDQAGQQRLDVRVRSQSLDKKPSTEAHYLFGRQPPEPKLAFVAAKPLGKVGRSKPKGGTRIYAIAQDGNLLFYLHAGTVDGSDNWPMEAKPIGEGWNFKQVLAGDDGAIYAVQDNGDLLFYKYAGLADGTRSWTVQGKRIDSDWNFKQVLAGSDGAFYAVEDNGDLLLYKQGHLPDGTLNWSVRGSKIGSGWSFRQVFAGDDGGIYAVQDNGDLLYYRFAGFNNGLPDWPIKGRKIDSNWHFKQVFAGDSGAIYAIKDNGELLFYKHAGYKDGSANWSVKGKKIGSGWSFKEVTAATN